jgi:ADP-ribose pyrophosphatase
MVRTELIHAARKFRVESWRRSDGDRPLDVIVHPGAAVILPLISDDEIVFVRNQRLAVGRELLELPAGTLKAGESPRECARRELEEETGYSPGALTELVRFYSSPGFCTELMHVFVARELTRGTASPEPGEELTVVTLRLEEALRSIRDGRICDAKTMAALLYWHTYVLPQ